MLFPLKFMLNWHHKVDQIGRAFVLVTVTTSTHGQCAINKNVKLVSKV